MHFKEWYLSVYGISAITEGKVINRVFLPAIPKNRPYLDALMQSYGGYSTTHNDVEGLSFTSENYNKLLLHLSYTFQHLNYGYFDAYVFESYKNRYFYRLGFNFYAKTQFRTQPNIHLQVVNEASKQNLLKNFAHYGAKRSYDPINKTESIEISSSFLNYLFNCYYRSHSAPKGSLKMLRSQKSRLESLMRQIQKNKLEKGLDLAKYLALDYDNNGSILDEEYCSAYAISLKIYAELHRFSMKKEDYDAFYAAAALLAAYDRTGSLKQCLKSDIIFMQYIKKKLYNHFLKQYNHPSCAPIAELAKDLSEEINGAINQNAEDLLYGNPKAKLNDKTTFSAARFLPDSEGNSDTDEIILHSGGMLTHICNFRLIKIAVMKNGQQAKAGEIPHHYEYFKVENNLGINCHDPDYLTKTCWGTYVTRIIPCAYSEERGFEHIALNPYMDPVGYQQAMVFTLKMIISIEHRLILYRQARYPLTPKRADPQSKEGIEWRCLFQANQILSGIPHPNTLCYMAQNVFNPLSQQLCFVQNERGYFQEGGSCPIFSLKSLVDSVLGHELTALHLSFMQENGTSGYISALKNKITQIDQTINKLAPLTISGTRDEIECWFKEFKDYLVEQGIHHPSQIPFSAHWDKAQFILETPLLKRYWKEFFKMLDDSKMSPQASSNSNCFFTLPENRPKSKLETLAPPLPILAGSIF